MMMMMKVLGRDAIIKVLVVVNVAADLHCEHRVTLATKNTQGNCHSDGATEKHCRYASNCNHRSSTPVNVFDFLTLTYIPPSK